MTATGRGRVPRQGRHGRVPRQGRRVGPWLAPALLVAEVGLVWTGLLPVRWAVASGVVLEILLWVTVGGRIVVAARHFRSSRSAGRDLWSAVEDGFAEVVPRKVARLLVLEPRLWLCLGRWCAGRHDGRRPRAFAYHGGMRVLFWAIFGYTCVELVVVEVVLGLAPRGHLWLWVSLGLHGYALVWLLGFWASLVTRPHLCGPDVVRLRDGVFAEVVIPWHAIVRARTDTRDSGGLGGRTGLRVDDASRAAVLAVGPRTTVVLTLDPALPVRVAGGNDLCLERLSLSADDPHGFVAALSA